MVETVTKRPDVLSGEADGAEKLPASHSGAKGQIKPLVNSGEIGGAATLPEVHREKTKEAERAQGDSGGKAEGTGKPSAPLGDVETLKTATIPGSGSGKADGAEKPRGHGH